MTYTVVTAVEFWADLYTGWSYDASLTQAHDTSSSLTPTADLGYSDQHCFAASAKEGNAE